MKVKYNRKRSDVFLEFLLGPSLVSVSDAGEEATTCNGGRRLLP